MKAQSRKDRLITVLVGPGSNTASAIYATVASVFIVAAASLLFAHTMAIKVFDGFVITSIVVVSISGAISALHTTGPARARSIALSSLSNAIFGGACRDLIWMAYPFWLQAPVFIAISLLIGFLISRFRGVAPSLERTVDSADRLALGCLAVVGAEKAAAIGQGAGAGAVTFMAFFAAFLTGAGGGLLRDLFILNRMPVAIVTPYGLCAGIGGVFHLQMVRNEVGAADLIWLTTTGFVYLISSATSGLHLKLVAEHRGKVMGQIPHRGGK